MRRTPDVLSETAVPHLFHFAPRIGWMNDPNGLIQRGDTHHLFFQHNPYATEFGPIHWGHATSTDLLSWVEQPIALTPGDAGDYDAEGCWSGCAVALPDGRVAMLYSANRPVGGQVAALALSEDEDLRTWVKSPENPVIGEWPPIEGMTDFRDHAVVPTGDGAFRQIIAGGGRHAGGVLSSYVSDGDDLSSWTYEGSLLTSSTAGLRDAVWECPDLFEDADTDVVILSWYIHDEVGQVAESDVIWLTGRRVDGTFTPDRYGRLDLGDRFYAPQSYTTADGRRLMFGWLRTQFDAASASAPSVGRMSLPRALTVVDGRVHQAPASEVNALVRTPLGMLTGSASSLNLEDVSALELVVTPSSPEALDGVTVRLVSSAGHITSVDLSRFAVGSSWVRDGGEWVAEPRGTTSQVRVLVDAGLIEAFTDDGRAAALSDLALTDVTRVELIGDSATTVEVAALGRG